MRKFATVLLAMLMLLACVVISAGAEKPEELEIMEISACDDITQWDRAKLDDTLNNGDTCVSYHYASIPGTGTIQVRFAPDNSYDISEMDYLVMDLYVSDAASFGAATIMLELSSSGTWDDCEVAYQSSGKGLFGNLEDGWNRVKLDLDMSVGTTGVFDPTAWNFMRFYNRGAATTGADGLTIAIDNLGFAAMPKAPEQPLPDGAAKTTFSFIVNTNDEINYLDNDGSRMNGSSSVRFADGVASMTYRYDLSDMDAVLSASWSARLNGQVYITASTDGKNWSDVYKWQGTLNEDGSGGMDATAVSYELTDYLDLSEADALYIKLSDAYPQSGWGPSVHVSQPVELSVVYKTLTEEEKAALEQQKQEQQAAAARAELEAKAQKVIDLVDALGVDSVDDFNEGNYKPIFSKIIAARTQYGKLEGEVKEIFDASGALQRLEVAEAAKVAFEAELEAKASEPEQPEQPSEPTPSDPEPTDPEPSEPTPSEPEPTEPAPEKNSTVVIVVVVAVAAAVIAAVVIVVLKKKKTQK